MKKVILKAGILFFILGLTASVNAACYEAYYPSTYCDTQGFDNCVNQICYVPPCSATDSCNPEVGG
jgi:hypothetical protein